MSEKIDRTPLDDFGKTAFILLCLNSFLWTLASFYTDYFFGGKTRWASCGTEELWPITDTDFDCSFSIEEWCIFVILPWVVVYFFKKIK
jgi:hypothetical protein